MKEGRKEGVGKNNKKEKKRERKEKKVWSAIGRVQFDVGCDRARPSIRNSRRGNKSSRKTCELVPCHQLWSVAIARRNIASNWEEREEGGIVLHAESACNGGNGERERSCSSRIPLLNGIKGTGLNLIGIGSRKKGDYYYRGRRGMVIGSADEGEILSKWRRFRAFQ